MLLYQSSPSSNRQDKWTGKCEINLTPLNLMVIFLLILYLVSHSVVKHKTQSNLSDIFKWLKDNGVKKVVRVSVLDYGDYPHSDSAIEEALGSLEVEIWDWKKVDICSDVISNSSKAVREISLYSSGNTAVLMGWGSPQGFVDRKKFPNVSPPVR